LARASSSSRSSGVLPIAFGAGGREAATRIEAGDQERSGGKAVRGKGEREEQKDTHSDNDERTRAALMGFTLYLCRRTGFHLEAVVEKGDDAGAQNGSISCGIED
jgi:hypothetical protein